MLKNSLTKPVLVGLLAIFSFPSFALDFEARQWSHLPVNINILGMGYAYTEAEIAVNPTLLLEDVDLELETWIARYIRTFRIFNRSARVDVTQGYMKGDWTGLLEGVPASTYRSGFSDTSIRFALNLYGAPPLTKEEYIAYRSNTDIETIVGLGLVVRLPTGEYMDDRLINLGENRFTFRPQFGVTHRRGRWASEVISEVAFHTDNDDFFNGKTREQDPTYIIHTHLTYTFRPGLWVSTGIGYDYVGENKIDNVSSNDTKENIGWLFKLAYPINKQSGINISYLGTRKQRDVGLDSDTLSASFSISW